MADRITSLPSFAIVALLIFLSSAWAQDQNAGANALFVAASQKFQEASKEPYDGAIATYQAGLELLDKITSQYPGSNLAVQLVSHQPVGIIKIENRTNPSAGMLPTIAVNGEMALFRFGSQDNWPRRGDLIDFILPKDTRVEYVKRVVGMPGDRIQMIQGVVNINGQPVKREQVGDFTVNEGGAAKRVKRFRETLPDGAWYFTLKLVENAYFDNTPVYIVPQGCVFVLGDNRDNSTDSRVLAQVGYVPIPNLLGRIVPRKSR